MGATTEPLGHPWRRHQHLPQGSSCDSSQGHPHSPLSLQMVLPRARLGQEVTAAARPARDPGQRSPPTAAAPLASVRGRALAPEQHPRVPNAQHTPGTSQGRAGEPGDGTEPRRARVARLTEAGLRQLGEISRYQRILEWLDSTFASRPEQVPGGQEGLEEQLQEGWQSQERGKGL